MGAGIRSRVVDALDSGSHPAATNRLGDFISSPRVIIISLLAIVVGVLSAFVALVLLRMIGFFTNLFFYQRFDLSLVSPANNNLGPFMLAVPVIGGLIIGFMARYGSERIRGHGIPEAIEAILINGSKVQPRVAFLKPLASAISIGSGGPFGAEGPIIMTGGAFGSMIAQFFHLTSAERKTLLVAGAAGGMAATFATPVAADPARSRATPLRMEAAQRRARGDGKRRRHRRSQTTCSAPDPSSHPSPPCHYRHRRHPELCARRPPRGCPLHATDHDGLRL